MSTDENGFEIGLRLQPVVERLCAWHDEVGLQSYADLQAEAARISLANRIDTAICLLRLCDKHQVSPGAFWESIPDLVTPSHKPAVRIVDDGETDNPAGWRELEFRNGVAVRLPAGAVVIGGKRTTPHTKPQPS